MIQVPLYKIAEKFKIFHIQPHLQFLSCIVCPNLCKIVTFIHCIIVWELRLKKQGLLRLRKRKTSEAVLAVFRCRKSCCRDSGNDENADPRGKEQMVMGLNCSKRDGDLALRKAF